MARIFPFRALRYDASRFDLARVLTQPYDKITPEMQERYYALDAHNLVRIEKGRALPDDTPQNNVYTRAAEALAAWTGDGTLRQDAAPCIYVTTQEFTVPGSKTRHTRRGFLALGRVEDYSAGVVFRHEQTHAAPRADRLELLRATRVNTGQLFMLFDDAGRTLGNLLGRTTATPPESEITDEFGVTHRLWPVADAALTAAFVSAMADKKLVIADGHHRYETALAYRNECRERGHGSGPEAPYEKALMTFFPVQDQGLVLLPTHRTVAGLPDFDFARFRRALEGIFDWYAYPFMAPAERETAEHEFRRDLAARGEPGARRRAIGVYPGGGTFYLFVLRREADLEALLPSAPAAQRTLDVVLLHRLLLERGLGLTPDAVERLKHISYHRDPAEALDSVDSGAAQAAFLLNPIPVREVFDLALAGNVLPQKSTDFYPKLLSGLAIYRMDA
jgi:uncharacterized protein (DUF1015 family)